MTRRDMTFWIDPPEGWRYGFPKEIDYDTWSDDEAFHRWLIANGYPEDMIPFANRWSRTWIANAGSEPPPIQGSNDVSETPTRDGRATDRSPQDNRPDGHSSGDAGGTVPIAVEGIGEPSLQDTPDGDGGGRT